MKTKEAFPFLLIATTLIACSPQKPSEVEREKIKQEVMSYDLAFSKYSQANGFAKALAEYADEDAIKLNPREYSAFGRAQLQKEADADSLGSSEGVLTWQPKKVTVSGSGDLASAFGDWFFSFKSPQTNRDTTIYGNYITVWKKQQDGSWKFILDGGNAAPGPTTEEMLHLIELNKLSDQSIISGGGM